MMPWKRTRGELDKYLGRARNLGSTSAKPRPLMCAETKETQKIRVLRPVDYDCLSTTWYLLASYLLAPVAIAGACAR